MSNVPPHAYHGARVMIEMHEQYLERFIEVWREAEAADVALPQTDDRDYASRAHLLRHVLGAARHYMVWMCKKLELPAPGIDLTPEPDVLVDQLDAYASHLVEKWRTPLVDVPEERFNETYPSAWKVPYCIDAMLEHAVMHPLRHTIQLERLMPTASS